MRDKKAFIFDLDGVLTDTAEYHYLAWKKLSDEKGLIFDKKFNDHLKGVSRIDSLKSIVANNKTNETDDTLQQWATEKNNYYLEFIYKITPKDLFPRVLELFDKLKQKNIKIALGSASKNAKLVLDRLNIIKYFDVIGDGTCVVRSKPAPDLFLYVANELRLSPKDCVVVEDAQAGIEAARAAKMATIGISNDSSLKHTDEQYSSVAEIVL